MLKNEEKADCHLNPVHLQISFYGAHDVYRSTYVTCMHVLYCSI